MYKVLRNKFESYTVAYAKWVLHHRWLVMAAALVIVGIFAVGMKNFVFNNNYDVFFDDDNPRMAAYDKVREEYSQDDTVFFVVTAKDGEIFDRRVLESITYLTQASWQLPYAARVDSLANFQHAWSEEDDLLVRPLIDSPAEMTDEELAQAREIAFNEPMLANRLVKKGSAVTGVNVTLDLPEDMPRISLVITEAANKLLEETESLFPEIDIRLTGVVPLNNSFLTASLHDMTTLIPAMLAILLFTMAVLLKSFMLMGAVLSVVVFAAFSALGLLSWFHYEVAGPLTMLPLIVLTLAVADCVHILMSVQTAMRNGLEKQAAIVESMRINMAPVFITSLTTAIGFLCMIITPVPPLRLLGVFTSFGVLAAWVLAITFLPAAVSLVPFRVRIITRDAQMRTIMARLSEYVIANKAAICVGLTIATIVMALYIPSIRVNNQFIEWFNKDYGIRKDTEYAMNNLTGIYQIIFNVPAKESGGVNDPEYLECLDTFASWLKAQQGVVHVNSVTGTIKRLNRAMHGDDPVMYRLPETRELAAQYMLLYEMSLPAGVDLNTEVNMDKSASRMVVTTSNLRSEDVTLLVKKAEDWQKENLPAYMFAPALGPAVMFAEVARTMMLSMMQSAPLALLLVSLTMMIALRSIKYGIISLPPNLMPLVVGFGIWGLQGWEMNFGMTTIVAMCTGIVVDDTVHFLSKYLRARRELSLSPEDGVRYAFSSVGTAMWVTSFILVAGFSIMMLSPMTYCINMGALTSFIIIAALIGDILFLPSLLIFTDGARDTVYASLSDVQHQEKAAVAEA